MIDLRTLAFAALGGAAVVVGMGQAAACSTHDDQRATEPSAGTDAGSSCADAASGTPPAEAGPTANADAAACSATTQVDPDIRALFDAYAKTLNDHTLVDSQAFFAPTFLVADPSGTTVHANDDARRAEIAKEDAFYVSIGMTSARIVFIEETSLNGHHVFVRTRWGCTFTKTGSQVTEFPLSFIVDRTGGGPPKIIVHVVEADEPKIFHDLGLL
jgi:hypothetical protein